MLAVYIGIAGGALIFFSIFLFLALLLAYKLVSIYKRHANMIKNNQVDRYGIESDAIEVNNLV